MIPYPAYKSTNLPWLPKIPEHWSRLRYKDILVPKDIRVGKDTSYTLLSLTKQGVIIRDISEGKGKFPKDFDTYKVVAKNDFILCLFDVDETPRTVGVANDNGMITGAYDIFTVRRCNLRWLYYHYLSLDDRKSLKSLYRGLRKTIPLPSLLSSHVYLPPVAEQEQIVRYLDSMTAKINKLIRAKKKQIALLQEQRQAIINQAVTKGLDPDVEMKNSGIDWIGEIPKHWNIKAFSKVASIKTNLVDPKLYGDYLQISPDKIEKNTGKLVNLKTVKESGVISNNHLFYKGQIIYSKIRPLLNKATIAPFDGLCSADMYPIETKLNTDYLLLYMLSPLFLYQIKQSGDRVKMPKINQEEMAKLLVIVPPPTEQKAISLAVHEKWDQIDNAITHFNDSILLLNEYKNSLISSVVTGQTDVRNIPVEDVIPDDLIPDNAPTSEIEEEPTNEESEE